MDAPCKNSRSATARPLVIEIDGELAEAIRKLADRMFRPPESVAVAAVACCLETWQPPVVGIAGSEELPTQLEALLANNDVNEVTREWGDWVNAEELS